MVNNMYENVKTWNPAYGICEYGCNYCYNRKWWKIWGKMRFNENAFKKNLGSNNVWFVGSSCDMFAKGIPNEWILSALGYIRKYPKNTYLLQSKNPHRFKEFDTEPKNIVWGTTIETNRDYKISKAPLPIDRQSVMQTIQERKFVTIEPIMDFDLDVIVAWMSDINPEFVYIGANSKKYVKLPEPSEEKIKALIDGLSKFTEVKIKDNLSRLGDFSSNEGMELRLNSISSKQNLS